MRARARVDATEHQIFPHRHARKHHAALGTSTTPASTVRSVPAPVSAVPSNQTRPPVEAGAEPGDGLHRGLAGSVDTDKRTRSPLDPKLDIAQDGNPAVRPAAAH